MWTWAGSTIVNRDMDAEEKIPVLSESSSSSLQDSRVQNYTEAESDDGDEGKIKVYRWRWVVLVVLVLNLSINNGIWIALSPIADVVKCYYSISDFWVNSTSMVYMLTYILFIVPSAWLLNNTGLRTTTVIAVCLNAAGACLRVAGTGKSFISDSVQIREAQYI